jgi:hypothetical protein
MNCPERPCSCELPCCPIMLSGIWTSFECCFEFVPFSVHIPTIDIIVGLSSQTLTRTDALASQAHRLSLLRS